MQSTFKVDIIFVGKCSPYCMRQSSNVAERAKILKCINNNKYVLLSLQFDLETLSTCHNAKRKEFPPCL